EYTDERPHSVKAVEDAAPEVKLFKPGKDESLAADATLFLEGLASDDIGVKELTLRMKLDKTTIESRSYRSDKEIRLPDGGYPHVLDYKEAVDLPALKDSAGKASTLKMAQSR